MLLVFLMMNRQHFLVSHRSVSKISNNWPANMCAYGIEIASLLIMNIEPPDDTYSIVIESTPIKAVFNHDNVLNRRICHNLCGYCIDYEY